MKRTIITAAILSLAFAASALAVESSEPAKAPAATFEQRKTEILKHIDERITRQQQEKACVEAAKSQDDLKSCREKYGPPHGPGGPGGPGRPGGPGGPGAPYSKPPPQDQ